MTRNEARKIIRAHTQTKYSNSVLLLLLKLLDLTYRKDKDNPERQIEATAASLMRAAGIKHRQLLNIITQLSADGVLLEVRNGKHVSCRLNLEPLMDLEAYSDKHKADKKQQDEARTKRARDKRQQIRELSQVVHKLKDAVDQDARDFVVKAGLLKEVKDEEIRRSMMNWDVDRISRAQQNAMKVLMEDTQQ